MHQDAEIAKMTNWQQPKSAKNRTPSWNIWLTNTHWGSSRINIWIEEAVTNLEKATVVFFQQFWFWLNIIFQQLPIDPLMFGDQVARYVPPAHRAETWTMWKPKSPIVGTCWFQYEACGLDLWLILGFKKKLGYSRLVCRINPSQFSW